jgi:hypothetical protein
MATDPMRLAGCPGQWRGHRDGDINERKEALYGPPCRRPFVTRSAALNRSVNVTEDDIARRAHELYLARDCEDGHDVDDWLQAERELQERSIP